MTKRPALLVLGALAIIAVVGLVLAGRPDSELTVEPPTSVTVERTTTTSRPVEAIPALVPDQRLLPSAIRAVEAGCSDPVTVDPPASDLALQIADHPPGTCFLLQAGTYDFSSVNPKDYTTFLGVGTDDVIVVGDSDTENAFHGTSTGVTIARMTITGFQGSAGEKRQEQAPIRGTSAIWASDRGQMATEWLLDELVITDNYASGVLLGDHFTVRNSQLLDNGVTGISASEAVGGLIEHNLVVGNGSEQLDGFEVNGGGMKFGETGTPDAPLVIRRNEVYDNEGIGIWCDIGCRGFHVLDNYIHDQSSRAVMFELSDNAVIAGNTIIDANSWADFSRDFNAGAITVGESTSVVVENNFISGAESAITIRQTLRPVRPQENFLDNYDFVVFETGDILVRNNVIERSGAVGISTGTTGIGLIPDVSSIRFEANRYNDPTGMRFWWADGERLDFEAWQLAGRDVVADADAVPDTTPWPFDGSSSQDELTATLDPIQLPIAINAGGDSVVDANGRAWVADRFFLGGNAGSGSGQSDGEASAPGIYGSERWGLRGYAVPVPNGEYRVEFHHAEIFEGCQLIGCRQFDIRVEGEPVATELDIFARVGGRTPLVLTSIVTVEDGVLDIDFVADVQEPQIAGLVIEEV